jgi:hypothetical protein
MDVDVIKKSLDVLRANTDLFVGWSYRDIYKLCDYARVLSF